MKALLHLILKLWFRFRAFDTSVLSAPGPVLLIPNHVSWLDWAFLAALLDDDWKFVTSSTTAQATWLHRKIMVNRRTFPVDPSSPYAAKRMAEFLQGGGRLVLFAEGRITLTGSMMKLFDGTGFLLHKTRARVILCYLRGAVRVPFVRHKGWTQWFPTVTAHFSPLLESPKLEGVSNTVARRRLTAWLRDRMLEQHYRVEMEFGPSHVLAAIAETASKLPGKPVLEDITFQPLNYRRLMTGVGGAGSAMAGIAFEDARGRPRGRAVAERQRGAGDAAEPLGCRAGAGHPQLLDGRARDEDLPRSCRRPPGHHVAGLSREGEAGSFVPGVRRD